MAKEAKVNPEKEKKRAELKERFQEYANKSKCETMGEFMTKWNKSNKEKIQDMVKIQDTIIIHLNSNTVAIQSNMRLG